ncbi:MAG: intradiol ring-cleavage dioxygenase [Bacteroidota bacterium]|nr:intradiol ring-cleavage dioxygenase [Bacteroidota bacterium]
MNTQSGHNRKGKFSLKAISFFLIAFVFCCCSTPDEKQNRDSAASSSGADTTQLVFGGPCDQCETMYEGMPQLNTINWKTTLVSDADEGERLMLTGKVFMNDGKTPAPNIVLYFHHTNAEGYYAPSDTQVYAKKDGHFRGWIKTNSNGEFMLNTIRPAPYPGQDNPAHIHVLVKEPGKIHYYIDEIWFDDDSLITDVLKTKSEKRGGNMIIHLDKTGNGEWSGHVDIVLGFNIPDYK